MIGFECLFDGIAKIKGMEGGHEGLERLAFSFAEYHEELTL